MPDTFKIGEAKTHFSELIARVEAGEEVIIARGDQPVARLVAIDEQAKRRAAMEAILALRDSGRIKPVSQEEVRLWKHEGHRY
jgi:prevent-host-death family protein